MPPMTSPDLDELERIARAATPGPWRWADWSATYGTRELPQHMSTLERNATVRSDPAPYVRQRGDGVLHVLTVESRSGQREENLAHIAANSPDVTLSLIAQLRAARAENEQLRAGLIETSRASSPPVVCERCNDTGVIVGRGRDAGALCPECRP